MSLPIRVVQAPVFGAFGRLFLFQLPIMDDKQEIIGLAALLDEVNRDIDELRKKHPGDYSVKNLTMWWELERERLVTRHSPASVVKKLRRVQGIKRMMIGFFAGWATMLAATAILRFWIP